MLAYIVQKKFVLCRTDVNCCQNFASSEERLNLKMNLIHNECQYDQYDISENKFSGEKVAYRKG